MLKGGKVLYILRPRFAPEDFMYDMLYLMDGEYGEEQFSVGDLPYDFIGEASILGLMDGEILDMMGENPKRSPPSPLHELDSDFHIISMI